MKPPPDTAFTHGVFWKMPKNDAHKISSKIVGNVSNEYIVFCYASTNQIVNEC